MDTHVPTHANPHSGRYTDRHPGRRAAGFTLTELLIVMGLIGVLVSLLLPALAKVRAAGNATACLVNLRQMGTAWTMYTSENKGRLMDYVWSTPSTPDVSWNGYWLGVMENYGVRGDTLLCPAAAEPVPSNATKGYGSAVRAWSGQYASNGTVVRLNGTMFRDSSYGYNRYLTAGGGFGYDGKATQITALRVPPSEVPAFLDAAYADVRPTNGDAANPVAPPPNLRGQGLSPASPDHWKFLLARHGRGVNVGMADGSAAWVPLADTYQLTWRTGWAKYRLDLPSY